MSSPNFVQIGGQGGRVLSVTPGSAPQTLQFLPINLPGQLGGGDMIYASRARLRVSGQLTNTSGGAADMPSRQILAQAFGQVRVYSPDLGEYIDKAANSVPLLVNHDEPFDNAFALTTRERPRATAVADDATSPFEITFEIPFSEDYLYRETDSCPWLPLFSGGEIDIDVRATNALEPWGWTLSGTWTAELVIDWFADKQALIHVPIRKGLYKVETVGPEYVIRGVGAPRSIDGVVPGCRLAILSWLFKGTGAAAGGSPAGYDNGFYAAFSPGGGLLPGTVGINRLDVPFRDQVSVDAVSAWLESFIADTRFLRARSQAAAAAGSDMAGWPNIDDPTFCTSQSLISDALNFWPFVWASRGEKISDLQKVDGDIAFTAGMSTPPGASTINLFRTHEICAYSRNKVLDFMDRMKMPHKERGGSYDYVPKYADGKRADSTTTWGMPLKIVRAA